MKAEVSLGVVMVRGVKKPRSSSHQPMRVLTLAMRWVRTRVEGAAGRKVSSIVGSHWGCQQRLDFGCFKGMDWLLEGKGLRNGREKGAPGRPTQSPMLFDISPE